MLQGWEFSQRTYALCRSDRVGLSSKMSVGEICLDLGCILCLKIVVGFQSAVTDHVKQMVGLNGR